MQTTAAEPRRIAMKVAYDGTSFLGWQRQATGRTVQGELENILGRLGGGSEVAVTGAGRTDSGVHAHGQVAHADITTRFDDARLHHALMRMSPPDLAIRSLVTVSSGFHARYGAISREYRYSIIDFPDPFRSRYAWRLDYPIDRERLDAASRRLPGRRDFTSLSKHNPGTPNSVCNVTCAEWKDVPGGLEFRVVADRFLYGMVRLLVGIQIDVARGKREPDEIDMLIEQAVRRDQSPAAPSLGLSLVEVLYPQPIFPA